MIDTFSKFAFAVPVKNKTGLLLLLLLVTEAFETLLKDKQPKNLQQMKVKSSSMVLLKS